MPTTKSSILAAIGLVILTACSINVYAQTEPEKRRRDSLDALIRSVGNRTDTAAARILADAAFGYVSFDSEYALTIATRAESLVANTAITPLRIQVMKILADVCHAHNKYPEAAKYYEHALLMAKSIGANAEIAYALIGLALIDRDQGAMDKAFKKSLEVMEFAQRAGDHRLTIRATTYLALGYFSARYFARADSIYTVALQQCRGVEDDDLRAKIYSASAALFERMDQPQRAIETYHKGLTLERRLGRSRNIGLISSNLALIFLQRDQLDSALVYEKISLRLYEQTKYDAGLANSLNVIGMTEVKLGRYKDAIASARRAMTYSEASRFLPELSDSYMVLTEAYSGLGDYKSALEANKQMGALQDSIYNAASAQKLAELETAQKEQEIKLLQSQQAQENIIRNSLVLGAVMLLVFAAFLIRSNQRKKRDNTRLAELNDKLFDANEELSLITSEKDEILNIVTHGLKSQIFGVRSLADSMTTAFAEGTVPQNTASLIEISSTISRAATQMFALVTNLLTVNAAEQGLLKPRLVKTNVARVLHNVCEQFKEYAAVKNITLNSDVSEQSIQVCAKADEQMLREVLENLVSNAVKYSPQGKHVFARVLGNNAFVRVEIQDEGAGISQDDMPKLFGKFARLSARPTGGEHSTGLGLSIVKKMAEAMNGKVWCESEVGKGATFIVELPSV